MEFTAKLRKIGNSLGIYIPKNVITSYKAGDIITVKVITSKAKEEEGVITSEKSKPNVITPPKRRPKILRY